MHWLSTLTIAATFASANAGLVPPKPVPSDTLPAVELGLTAPIDRMRDVDSFGRSLAENLVWTLERDAASGSAGSAARVRFTAVRIDRRRVAASFQSAAGPLSVALSRIVDSIGEAAFQAFVDESFHSGDPPADVHAVSGKARLDPEALERAIGLAAAGRDVAEPFGLDRPLGIEPGRHILIVLAAASSDPVVVRPLILVLELK